MCVFPTAATMMMPVLNGLTVSINGNRHVARRTNALDLL